MSKSLAASITQLTKRFEGKVEKQVGGWKYENK